MKSEKYMDLMEAACNALDDLQEARSRGASSKTIDRLQGIYSNKAYKIIRLEGTLPPKESEIIERALRSLGF